MLFRCIFGIFPAWNRARQHEGGSTGDGGLRPRRSARRLSAGRRAVGHSVSRDCRRPPAQCAGTDRDGFLVDQPLHRLRIRLHLLLCAIRAQLCNGAGRGCGQTRARDALRRGAAPSLVGVRAPDPREAGRAGSASQLAFPRWHTAPYATQRRGDCNRNGDRPVPTCGEAISRYSRAARGPGRAQGTRDRGHHQESADNA